MRHFSLRKVLPLVSAGLMLAACGGAPDETLEPSGTAPESAPSALSTEGASLTAPSVSLSCARVSVTAIECTASVSGGVAPYTYFWGQQRFLYMTNRYYNSTFNQGTATHRFSCIEQSEEFPGQFDMKPKAYVVDATGAQPYTTYSGTWFGCG